MWQTASPLHLIWNIVASFEWWVGLRYTRAKRRNGFISFISGASMAGIALGVAALIVVLSVMNGFQREIRSRMLEATSHAQVSGADGKLANWADIAARLAQHPSVKATAPFVQSQGLLRFDGTLQGVMARGIDPAREEAVVTLGKHMSEGQLEALKPGEFGIVLGNELARSLGARMGDKVTLFVAEGNVTPAGVFPRYRQFTVVGLFHLDMYQVDASLALMHISDAQKLYRMGDEVSGVRMRLIDPLDAPRVTHELSGRFSEPLYFSDWTLENSQYFRAVQIEKRMMFLILTLIVAVAAFNLVSSLVMTVTDKQADIAILRTLGASPFSIMQIFIVQGAIIGLLGTLLGLIGGVIIGFNAGKIVGFFEGLLGMQILSPQIYLVSQLPSEVQAPDVITVAIIALVLAFVATLYPSWRASRINPAEALRYE